MGGALTDTPVYNWCGCPIGSASAADQRRRADESYSQRRKAEATLLTAEAQIKSLAAELQRRGSLGLVTRSHHVTTTRKWFRDTDHYDFYERAWPVPDQLFDLDETHTDGGGVRRIPTGVTPSGQLVPLRTILRREEPVERAQERGRLYSGPHQQATDTRRSAADLQAVIESLKKRLS